jgi:hypothetical protein
MIQVVKSIEIEIKRKFTKVVSLVLRSRINIAGVWLVDNKSKPKPKDKWKTYELDDYLLSSH